MAILVLQHSDSSPVGRLGATLRDYGLKLDIRNLHRGDDLPPDLDDIDAIISCGGPQSANDDSLEWMAGEMDLLRRADALQMPVLGICLGCQILGRALGGTVAEMEAGIEFGWHEVRLNAAGAEDPIHTGIAWNAMMVQHHRFEVSELPPDARTLASSDHCRNQVWLRGLRTYGVQYHPEADAATLIRWAKVEPSVLDDSGLTMDVLQKQINEHYPAFERLTRRMFESIALFLMPVDRRYHGIAKDVHH